MSISYPLSLPSSPSWMKVNFTADNIVGVSKSPFTKQQEVYEWPGESWMVDVSLPPMDKATAEAWVTFLVSLRGCLGTFYIGDDTHAAPNGVATGTPQVNGAQTSGSKTLATKGWTHNITGILKAGDFLQVGTGSSKRLYKVLNDANSDSSGYATVDIFPRLREGVSDNQSITLTTPKGTFRLMTNDRTWNVDTAQHFGIDFKAEEAF